MIILKEKTLKQGTALKYCSPAKRSTIWSESINIPMETGKTRSNISRISFLTLLISQSLLVSKYEDKRGNVTNTIDNNKTLIASATFWPRL